MERIEVELDALTTSWLRQRCAPGGSLAEVAAAQLRTDAFVAAAKALAAWERRHPGELLASIDDAATALGEVG